MLLKSRAQSGFLFRKPGSKIRAFDVRQTSLKQAMVTEDVVTVRFDDGIVCNRHHFPPLFGERLTVDPNADLIQLNTRERCLADF
ncbi:hypothetical protein [Bradyrhizobium sp. CCBAU 51765]|uniref:hypothetical protein n=1 Tax=Bradyrhizobium sp. CCBAU 51765 TaxID=1325102 RepID=UPI001888867B|nr:hypothetical protein [Bradyrhizobium sp. CCBAU 51765]